MKPRLAILARSGLIRQLEIREAVGTAFFSCDETRGTRVVDTAHG